MAAALIFACASGISAYDPPKGASLLGKIYAPWGMADAMSLSELGSDPWTFLFNPASPSLAELLKVDVAYTGIADMSAGSPQGWGSAAFAAASLPQEYGVWNASMRLFSAPGTMTSMPLGTFVTAQGGFSKKVSSMLSVGASASIVMGGNGGFGWGIWSDIGAVRELGDLGFLKNARLGFVMSGIGKEFNYAVPPMGFSAGSLAATGFPAAFSPGLGLSADLVNDSLFNLRGGLDLRFPSMSDLETSAGIGVSYKNLVNLTISMATSIHDIQQKSGRSAFPSLTLSGFIPLGVKGPHNTSISSIAPSFGVVPLYDSLDAFSLGAELTWGQSDKSPPEVKLQLPAAQSGAPVSYVSPNADGTQDWLEIPISVHDEQRTTSGWYFKIEDRSSGKVVRTITEETKLPRQLNSFAAVKDGFSYVKKNVVIPDAIRWDGRDDEGNFVPEGTYIASFLAWDDRDNKNVDYDSCLNIVIDRTPPSVNTWVMGEEQTFQGNDSLIFSPDSDNNKDTIAFRTQGSVEDNWKYEIIDESGKAVRTVEQKGRSAPRDFVWDGTDDVGKRVPDGNYQFRLSSVDPAGNVGYRIIGSAPNKSDWIVVDTSRPAVKVVVDKKAFSPIKAGASGTLDISFNVESLKNLVSWKASIQDQRGKSVWTASGDASNPPAASILFSGRDASGNPYPDGQYRAGIEMKYRNGYSPIVYSDNFVLDATPPSASIELDDARAIFSPDGDGNRDALAFNFDGSREDLWNLEIRDAGGQAVYTEQFRDALPEHFVWEGRDLTGRRIADGNYTIELQSIDVAGNEFRTGYERIIVDTRAPGASISLNRDAFSPNDDGVADVLGAAVKMESLEGLMNWKLDVVGPLGTKAAARATLLADEGANPPPASLQFDGKVLGASLAEGSYRLELSFEYENGWEKTQTSPDFVIDITAPTAQVSRSREFFNPRGDAMQSQLIISQIGSREVLWTGELRNEQGAVMRRWEFKNDQPGEIVWDGRTVDGALLPDGVYSYRLICVDAAGNSFASDLLSIGIDTMSKQASISANYMAISPNGDGVQDIMQISINVTAADTVRAWRLAILSGQETVMEWKGEGNLPKSIVWDGTSLARLQVPDGNYSANFSASYPNSDSTQAGLGPLVIDRQAPKTDVKISGVIFSPNGDGVNDSLAIQQTSVPGDNWRGAILDASGKENRSWTWQGAAQSFEWDGRDDAGNIAPDGKYRYRLEARDAAGNSFSYTSENFEIETERKAVRLTLSDRAFSPNGDGVKDAESLALEIVAPEKVREYTLQIVAQDGPAALSAVRTWKGEAPLSQYMWRGETDAQIPAPDGHYAASIKVVYRNGDEAESATGTFILDRQFPKIDIAIQGNIFSPDGDGRSDTLAITQKSVLGDDWIGTVKDSAGNVVRTWTWQLEAKDFVWDGRNANGAVVPDGLYIYSVESQDSAGNRTAAGAYKIQVETGRRTVQLRVSDQAFSPNNDGIKDELVIYVEADARDRIKQYSLVILDKSGQAVRSWKGSADLASEYRWNSTNGAGGQVLDGDYSVSLEVLYLNDAFAKAGPIAVAVDRIAPKAAVNFARTVFSPNGDGRSDTLDIVQTSVYGDRWNAQIVSEAGKILRTWEWYPALADLSWDGKDQNGKIVPDGVYYYELRSIDDANNTFILPRQRITVDAAKKNVSLRVEPSAFSPNEDGLKDATYINIAAPKPETLLSYSISVYAGARAAPDQAPLRNWKGTTDLKTQYLWNGTADAGLKVPDGTYSVYLSLEYSNGDVFNVGPVPAIVDTVAPKISISADSMLFSPNGDGIKDYITITQASEPGDDWSGKIRSASGAVVRSYTWKGQAKTFTWDGTDSNGKVVPNGTYSYEVVSVDAAGNSASAQLKGITVDATKPKVFVSASDTGISPNDDGIRDDVSFSITVENREGIDSWRFSLLDSKGTERSFFGGSGSDVPTRLVWDGRDLQGQVVEDSFTGKLVVRYLKGDVAEASSGKIIVKIAPPSVTIAVKPEYFSPDGDGVDDSLTFGISADKNAGITEWKLEVRETAIVESAALQENAPTRTFMTWSGKGNPPSQISWNGTSSKGELVESATDYPFVFTCWDALGNQTMIKGLVSIDVLVIRDGDRLKIRVPSIVFRANHADFIGLGEDIVARNGKVIARIAQILGKFPDYRVRVEGHGNNIGKMLGYSATRIQQEETNELIPLSTERAEVVRKMLAENGVDPRRLSVAGLGSSEPVVAFTDVENRWKNRRVEFVLIRNP